MATKQMRHKATGIVMDVTEHNTNLCDGANPEWEMIPEETPAAEKANKKAKADAPDGG